ncbi:MAG: methionine synthase [Thermoplasmataceae archaeon]
MSREFITQEIGSFRKPEYLSTTFRKGGTEVGILKERATLETLELFRKSGIENVGVGGEMFRWEMYEHLAEHMEGIKFHGFVRSFDNRYFRKGSVVSELRRTSPFHLDELRYVEAVAPEEIKVPITGAYTMTDWSFNEHYKDRHDLAMDFSDAIHQEIKELRQDWIRSGRSGPLQVQIDEPAATTHPSEMDILRDTIERSIEGIQGCEFTIHVCYSTDYRILYRSLADTKLHGYNLEFANRDTLRPGSDPESRIAYQEVRDFADMLPDRFLGLGVTDVHIDQIESPELIRDRISYAIKFLDPGRIRLNPDCGLRTRSREVGFGKLDNMVRARNLIEEES